MKFAAKNKKQPKITSKKTQGEKSYYLVVKGRSRKWIDSQNLGQYQELVTDYEREQEDIKQYIQEQDNHDSNTREQQKKDQTCDVTRNALQKKEDNKQEEKESEMVKRVINMIFMNKSQGQFYFRLYFEDGKEEIMISKQIRYKYPQELITFYENNIEIAQKEDGARKKA